MEPNEQSRRSREYSSYFETLNSTRFGSSKLLVITNFLYTYYLFKVILFELIT